MLEMGIPAVTEELRHRSARHRFNPGMILLLLETISNRLTGAIHGGSILEPHQEADLLRRHHWEPVRPELPWPPVVNAPLPALDDWG